MYHRTWFVALPSAVVLAAISTGPLAAQVRMATPAPTATMPSNPTLMAQPATAVPPRAPHLVLVVDGVNLPVNNVTGASTGTVEENPQYSGARSGPLGQPRRANEPLLVTVSENDVRPLFAWSRANGQGRMMRKDLTLSVLAPTGRVERQCLFKRSLLRKLTTLGSRTPGVAPSYRGEFIYESVQCMGG
jgi:hypothetical protein